MNRDTGDTITDPNIDLPQEEYLGLLITHQTNIFYNQVRLHLTPWIISAKLSSAVVIVHSEGNNYTDLTPLEFGFD